MDMHAPIPCSHKERLLREVDKASFAFRMKRMAERAMHCACGVYWGGDDQLGARGLSIGQ
jgi:hypothetical protein